MVNIDRERCQGCGLCIEKCPAKALTLDQGHKSHLTYPAQCIYCGMCEAWCSRCAITVDR